MLQVWPRGIYKVPVVITNPGAVTNIQLTAHATKPCVLIGVNIDAAQATLPTDANIRLRFVQKTATATGLTSVAATTFVNISGAPDATFTVGHTATGEGTDGDFTERGWNSRQGFEFFPSPEMYIYVPSAGMLAIKHNVAPPAAVYAFELTIAELP